MKYTTLPQCSKHGYDYQICCEECQEKYKVTMKMIDKTRKVYEK